MIAYNKSALKNLQITKESKSWLDAKFVSKDQFIAICAAYPSDFYHPNVAIRILLFLATSVAIGGVTGLFALILFEAFEDAWEFLLVMYGGILWAVLEFMFIRSNKHYKSGVNEALMYHSAAFVLTGIAAMSDFNGHFSLFCGIAVTLFCAIRYADLVATALCLALSGGLLFYECYEAGPALQQLIPVIFIIAFSALYAIILHAKSRHDTEFWSDCLTVAEFITLLVVYAAGNYLVVRELSISMLGLELRDGSDIPLALLFYFLTVAIPLLYVYFGIHKKDILMLRAGLTVLAFSVFTFKYYYSLGYHEITLTLSGAALIATALWIYRSLRTDRGGFTREKLLPEKWAEANAEAFVISQTLGGNKPVGETIETGSGGESAGGGASNNW